MQRMEKCEFAKGDYMAQQNEKKSLNVSGMTCVSCEQRIERGVSRLEGVDQVKADFTSSKVEIVYDSSKVQLEAIIDVIQDLDYPVLTKPLSMKIKSVAIEKDKGYRINIILGLIVVFMAGYLIINNTVGFNFIPSVAPGMSYGVLFVVGLFTSLHCVAMCGGINLSQCVNYKISEKDAGTWKKFKPSFLYNAGRVTSYTIIGGVVGTLGSVVSFSGGAKGIVAIISGGFMVIMGLNMLNVIPALRKFNPRIPKGLSKTIRQKTAKSGPYLVGLANGLMPCGPLQAMQLYALGTGSFLVGASSMFFFSLGTVPLMFGFGALSTYLGKRFRKDMILVSSILVIVLGVIMAGRGFSLSGVSFASIGVPKLSNSLVASAENVAVIDKDIQIVTTDLSSKNYTHFVVQKGIPVRWNFKVAQGDLNGCNSTVLVPQFNIEKTLVVGDNIIEFTPSESGEIPYTCWMGMITSSITVVDDISQIASVSDKNVAEANVNTTKTPDKIKLKILDIENLDGSTGFTTEGSTGPVVPFSGDIHVAKIINNEQIIEVRVDSNGYTPEVIVVQKGINTKIVFTIDELTSCNSIVVFPEYQGQLDLQVAEQRETPWLVPETDFTFHCSMSMLFGYVKVVDDINSINMDDIRTQIGKSQSTQSAQGGGCCGG